MNARVKILGMTTFTNKRGRGSYVLNLEVLEERPNTIGHEVYKAFTSEKHYITLLNRYNKAKEPIIADGYLNFDNGFTNFYLPKGEVID